MNSGPGRKAWVGRSNQPPQPECCRGEGQAKASKTGVPTEQPPGSVHRDKHGPQAGVAPRLSNPASKHSDAGGDDVALSEPNMMLAAKGEVRVSLPGSKSVARAEGVAWNLGGPGRSRRTNCESQAGRGAQRQEERPDASQGVGFVHSSPRQDASLEVGEGADRLTKSAQATRCRKNDGSILANLPAGDTQRVSLKSPVREYRPPGSVRGAPGNRRPYRDPKHAAAPWQSPADSGPSPRPGLNRCNDPTRPAPPRLI